MNQAAITYDQFINELRLNSKEPRLNSLLNSHGENLLNDLLGLVDTFTCEKEYFEAEKILQVLAKAFNQPEFYSALALSQKNQNKFTEAKVNYKKSLALDSSLFKIYYNYGILLYEMKEYEEAIESFQQSALLNTECDICFYNLGNCYREIEEFEKAKDAYAKAIKIKPDYEDAIYNLGVVNELLGENEVALNNYDEVISINNNNVQAHWNKSLLLLQKGNYKEGFKEYEWRLKKKDFKREFPFPYWNGEDLTGKKILIYCEQGFGDAIQFVRFVKLLNAEHSAVECREELKTLFQKIEFINEVIVRDTKIYHKSEYDFVVSIMSLLLLLKIDLNEIESKAYIKADDKKSNELNKKLNNNKYKVGVVWAGNQGHQNDKFRSIDSELLFKNLSDEKVELCNLQIKLSDEDKKSIEKFGVHNLTDKIKDFSDTAAAIEKLDLVICVDTSIAHLAGAMGKETFVLLPFNPDWRWLLEREDSPWYSSVKLFRQKNKNEWNEVLQKVRLEMLGRINDSSKTNEYTKMNFDENYSAIEKLINNNKLEEALKEIEFALKNDPLPYRAFNYLGILFSKTKNYVKAEEYFLKTISLKPDFTDAVSNLGIIYFEQNRFEESIVLHKKAIELNDKNVKSYFNLAYAYQETGELEKAKANYEKAVELNSDYADAQFNLALLKLLLGEYKETWRTYNEWAFKSDNRTVRNFNKPKWNGENFVGKKLYVYPDQGLGDAIQLVRYLPLVKERGGEVIFECQPALFDLLKNINGFDKIVKTNNDLSVTEEYDLHIPLQNLPEIFETTLETIPGYSFEIKVSEEKNQKWNNKIGNSQKYKIGFVWTGNAYPPINKKRHAGLNDFIPLFEIDNAEFYSLQLGEGKEELKHYKEKFNIFDFTNEIENFEDTAAIINNLDLVVTIDTSVAHLAGAMNKKVFTLLPFIPDWRWGIDSNSTPWYPSMKLFRQKERGGWKNVFAEVKEEILKLSAVSLQRSVSSTQYPATSNRLYLALSAGENFGWGVCSKYLNREVPKLRTNTEVWNFFEKGNIEAKVEGTVFHALAGLEFETLSKLRGEKNIGYTFFENELNDLSVVNSKKYEMVLGGSTWNKEKMIEKGITNAGVLIQGIDPEVFYPVEEKTNEDFFIIFSGGKFELRKGQDLVLKAVKIMQEKYHDIILVNAWFNMWPKTMDLMSRSKHIKYERTSENYLDVMKNLYAINEMDTRRIFTYELINNKELREFYSQTDIGLFPNRCEGGTNLVLMEYMACAKPVIGSFNTGHKDVLTEDNSLMLTEMKDDKIYFNNTLWADWEEPSLDEIIVQLEYAYHNRDVIRQKGKNAGEFMKNFTWTDTAKSLVKTIESI